MAPFWPNLRRYLRQRNRRRKPFRKRRQPEKAPLTVGTAKAPFRPTRSNRPKILFQRQTSRAISLAGWCGRWRYLGRTRGNAVGGGSRYARGSNRGSHPRRELSKERGAAKFLFRLRQTVIPPLASWPCRRSASRTIRPPRAKKQNPSKTVFHNPARFGGKPGIYDSFQGRRRYERASHPGRIRPYQR